MPSAPRDAPVRPVIVAAHRIGHIAERTREAMARFPTGVAIATTYDVDGRPRGLTISSLCSVSMDPPLLLMCVARTASCFGSFVANPRFAINLLAQQHAELAIRFASRNQDKFARGRFVRSARGAIVLADALAVLECEVYARHDGGDHVIIIGQVDEITLCDEGPPAVYVNRGFSTIGTR